MGAGLSRKSIVGLALVAVTVVVITTVIIPVASRRKAAAEQAQFDRLDKEWMARALSANPDQPDPRRYDTTSLPTASGYLARGVEIISASHHERPGVAASWRIGGGIVDLVKKGDTTYALYGKQVGRYESGIWNNVLDPDRSFDSTVLIKYKDGQAEVLDYHLLGPRRSQVSVGLRLAENGTVESLQNRSSNTADDAKVVGVYR